jgi:hypothetical protein
MKLNCHKFERKKRSFKKRRFGYEIFLNHTCEIDFDAHYLF